LNFPSDLSILLNAVQNDKTVESAVRERLCTGCGTCVGMCPKDAIEMVVDHQQRLYVPQLDREKCNECGLCFNVCPGYGVDFKQLNLDTFGKEPEDILMGNYLNCYFGYATDHDIRYDSTSGGVVTALLIFALEQGLIDGALVTRMRGGRPLEPQPFIARTRDEIISASKSKYCPVPVNIALKEILEAREGQRFAVVGLPCHIQGIRKAEMVSRKLRERIPLHLGLFCVHTSTFCLMDFLLQKYGIGKEDVAQFHFRGRGWPGHAVMQAKNGRAKYVPLAKWLPWHTLGFFIPKRCTFCSDGLAELADISFGDAWLPDLAFDKVGRSLIICRNEIAEQVLLGLVSQGRARVEKTDASKVVRAQRGLLYQKKKSLTARISLFHRNMRQPDYSLGSDVLDYICAIYQHYNHSIVSSHPFIQRILERTPVEIVRLYNLPWYAISKIQIKRVIKNRYGVHKS